VVKETTYNQIPVDSPDWETLRFTSESLTATPQVSQSEEIRSDRMVGDQFKTSTDVGGGFDFEFSADTYDSLIDGAMMSTPVAGVWKIGAEDISFSMELNYTDLSANNVIDFSGERVGTMDIGFTFGEAINGAFEMAGATVVSASDSAVGAGNIAPATTTRIMNAVSDLSGIQIDGVAFTGCLRAINLNINNNLRPAECIGSDTPQDQILGTAEVTGSIEAYLTDVTVQWYTDKVLNQVPMAISFALTDGTTTYTFNIPNAKISGDTPDATGINSDVMITADFTALYDATADSSLVITKS
jgi:hypothetical protein